MGRRMGGVDKGVGGALVDGGRVSGWLGKAGGTAVNKGGWCVVNGVGGWGRA